MKCFARKVQHQTIIINDKRKIMMSIVTTVDNEFLENFHLLYNEKHDNNTLKFYCPYIDANSMSF